MCGLTGAISLADNVTDSKSTLSMFRDLYVLSQLRGYDSSGAFACWEQGHNSGKAKKIKRGVKWAKDIAAPTHIFNKLWHQVASIKTPQSQEPCIPAIIGHARAATKGDVVLDNAHPFSFDNNKFVGVHNGTISSPHKLYNGLVKDKPKRPGVGEPPRDYSKEDPKITDSEVLLYCIYAWGIEEVYPRVNGARALIWWEEEDKSINIIRNFERNLYFSVCGADNGVLISSEKEMLDFVLDRRRQTAWFTKPEEFTVNHLYKLKPYEWRKDKIMPLNVWQEKKYIPSYVALPAPVFHYHDHWEGHTADKTELTETKGRTYLQDSATDEFCGWCGADMTISAKHGSARLGDGEIICGSCMSDPGCVEGICTAWPRLVQTPVWAKAMLLHGVGLEKESNVHVA